MSEEEIKKQYANGIVNADEVIKSLIDKFKTDKTSVDIQQLQLIAEYLLYKVDKLQKENEELKNKLNSFYGKSVTNFINKDKIRENIDTKINIVIVDRLNSKDAIQIAIDKGIEELLKMIRQELLGE